MFSWFRKLFGEGNVWVDFESAKHTGTVKIPYEGELTSEKEFLLMVANKLWVEGYNVTKLKINKIRGTGVTPNWTMKWFDTVRV